MFFLWVSYDQLKAIDTSLEFISTNADSVMILPGGPAKERRVAVSPARAEGGETCYTCCNMCKDRCGQPHGFRLRK